MLARAAERKVRLVRGFLVLAWLALILTLFRDPFSPGWTAPESTSSPFRLSTVIQAGAEVAGCVRVQGHCLPAEPYAMGARIFWAMIVPLGILIVFVFGHELWRRICPLAAVSQLPAFLGLQRQRKVVEPDGSVRHEVARVPRDSWLGRNHLVLQLALFFCGLCLRLLFINSDRTSLGVFLLLVLAAAITTGYLYGGRSWCHYFCPFEPVQLFYTGPRGLLDSEANQGPQGRLTQSMCRVPGADGKDRSACVNCIAPCIDIDAERSYWDGINHTDQKLLYYVYPGLVFAFYFYYFLYAGNWEYYYSGAWTHEVSQWALVLAPGVYLAGKAVPIPRLLAVPLTLGALGALSYLVFGLVERGCRALLRRRGEQVSEERVHHVVFSLAVWLTFNLFFAFGARPNLRLLPHWVQLGFNGLVMLVSTLWLHRTLGRSAELHARETLAGSLRRQLQKLGGDLSRFLEGRSLDQLKPDELYVLAKVLPNFTAPVRLKAYQGVLHDALESGLIDEKQAGVLRRLRQDLSISEEEHRLAWDELGALHPELLQPRQPPAPAAQGAADAAEAADGQRRIGSYRDALELLLLELVQSGAPLSEAFARHHEPLELLRQQHAITPDQEAQVVASLFDPGSPLRGKAEGLLKQLEQYAVWHRSLGRRRAGELPVLHLVRAELERRQEQAARQLLSVVEMVGDTEAAAGIARKIGVLAPDRILELLAEDGAGWASRLTPGNLDLLTAGANPGLGQNTDVHGGSPASWRDPSGRLSTGPFAAFGALTGPIRLPDDETGHVVVPPMPGEVTQVTGVGGTGSGPGDGASETADWDDERTLPPAGARAPSLQSSDPSASQRMRTLERRTLLEMLEDADPMTRAVSLLALQELEPAACRAAAQRFLGGSRPPDWSDEGNWVLHETAEHVLGWPVRRPPRGVAPDRGRAVESVCTLQKVLRLIQCGFLPGLRRPSLVGLARRAQLRLYQEGELICAVGEPCSELHVLTSGAAQVRVPALAGLLSTPPGSRPIPADGPPTLRAREQVVGEIGPGEPIGELGILTRALRLATVVASRTDTSALVVSSADFEEAVARDAALLRHLLGTVSVRVGTALAQNLLSRPWVAEVAGWRRLAPIALPCETPGLASAEPLLWRGGESTRLLHDDRDPGSRHRGGYGAADGRAAPRADAQPGVLHRPLAELRFPAARDGGEPAARQAGGERRQLSVRGPGQPGGLVGERASDGGAAAARAGLRRPDRHRRVRAAGGVGGGSGRRGR